MLHRATCKGKWKALPERWTNLRVFERGFATPRAVLVQTPLSSFPKRSGSGSTIQKSFDNTASPKEPVLSCKEEQSNGLHVLKLASRTKFSCSEGDVEALEPHERMGYPHECCEDAFFISDEDLKGTLQTTLPFSMRGSNRISLINPKTARQLSSRLLTAATYSPPPSISRLIKYHDNFPHLHSAFTYNTIIKFAIRHSNYRQAFRLFNAMEEQKIRPTTESRLLYVRLLVRTGHSAQAWNFIRLRVLVHERKRDIVRILAELLGREAPEEISISNPQSPVKGMNRSSLDNRSVGNRNESSTDYRPLVLPALTPLMPHTGQASHHVIYMIVKYLLQISQIKIAQEITLHWISTIPKCLDAIQRRQCLRILHLHLGHANYGLNSHFRYRQFINSCLEQGPTRLRPTSSTLFLMLRSLIRARGSNTYHAISLAIGMRKKWGPYILDSRVRRRIVEIAVQEGCLRVARKWILDEARRNSERQEITLERAVIGESISKPTLYFRRIRIPRHWRRPEASTDRSGRSWRFTKRRFWRKWISRMTARKVHSVGAPLPPPRIRTKA